MKPKVQVIGIHHNQELFIKRIATALKEAGYTSERIVQFIMDATLSSNPYYLLTIAPQYVHAY